ncbi:MAG: hypothetical protein M1142_00645 [Patescibacteria group bacterium]|nr:hypothetical protein [Patescibacteria group bacterium]
MLDNNDLQKIGQLIDQRAVATEEKLSKSLGEHFDQMLIASEKRIIKEIGDFITSILLPQLDEKAGKNVTDRLDNRLDKMSDQVLGHEKRLKKLEDTTSVQSLQTV